MMKMKEEKEDPLEDQNQIKTHQLEEGISRKKAHRFLIH